MKGLDFQSVLVKTPKNCDRNEIYHFYWGLDVIIWSRDGLVVKLETF